MNKHQLDLLIEKILSADDFNHNEKLGLGDIPIIQHEKIHSENPHYKDISKIHASHLRAYTDESSHTNRHLYNDGSITDQYHASRIKHMDDLTRKPTNTEHHVYSGTRLNIGEYLKNSKDEILHLKAYTSTSMSHEVANRFGHLDDGDMLHIHVKKGDKIHHVHPDHAVNATEREGILPRNTKLKIHPEHDEYSNMFGDKRKIYHATIHSQDE